jgi:transposase
MENLRKALIAVKHGMSLRNAEKKYGVPKSTLERAKNEKQRKKAGGQCAISKEMEEVMVKKNLVCASWGYPLDTLEIRLFVKSVLV